MVSSGSVFAQPPKICKPNAQHVVVPCDGILLSPSYAEHLLKQNTKVPLLEKMNTSYSKEVEYHKEDKKNLKKKNFYDKILYFFLGAAAGVLAKEALD